MPKSLLIAWFVTLAFFGAAFAQLAQTGAGKGTPTGYQGPGDLGVSFAGWWGLRAYSAAAALAQVNAVQITDNSLAHTQDITVLPSGDLDRASVNTFFGSFGSASVNKFYDQSGNGKDTTSNSGISPFATLPIASDRTVSITDNATIGFTIATFSLTQSFMLYAVGSEATDIDNATMCGSATTVDVRIGFRQTLQAGIYAGGANLLQTSGSDATTGNFHVIQGIYNGNSSVVDIDNVSAHDGVGGGGIPGAANLSDFGLLKINGGTFSGNWRECGAVAGLTAINSSVNANAKTYWSIP